MSNSNTRFRLLKEGFYKITILLLLESISPNSIYWVRLYRNDTTEHYLYRVVTNADVSNPYYQIEASLYIKSTGLDSFMIRCHCTGDTSFTIALDHLFLQLSIEYSI